MVEGVQRAFEEERFTLSGKKWHTFFSKLNTKLFNIQHLICKLFGYLL